MSDDEMRKLAVPKLQDEGYIFLWVTGRCVSSHSKYNLFNFDLLSNAGLMKSCITLEPWNSEESV